MAALSIFANFFIDTEERLQRMKDSFQSMKPLHELKWLVNVRGSRKDEAASYLKKYGVTALSICSGKGWFADSKTLSETVASEYLLLWIEDHICLRPDKVLPIVAEMQKNGLDIITYTFWNQGQMRRRYENTDIVHGNETDWFEHTLNNNVVVQANEKGSYLVSYASILKTSLFKKILLEKNEFKWPKETPFDFEAGPTDLQWLPLKRAIPKYEIFASVDDDLGCSGSCLQARGLYPKREGRLTYTASVGTIKHRIMRILKKCWLVVLEIQFVIKLAFTPGQFKHLLRWFKSRWKKDSQRVPEPWMVFDAIDFIKSHIGVGKRIFEYGSGDSTLFWLSHGMQVVTVDHDPVFFAELRKKIGDHNSLEYSLVEPQRVQSATSKNPSDPDDYFSSDKTFFEYSFRDYAGQIDKYPDNSFDIVSVDGRARPSCVKHAIKKVKIGGILVLDDSNREYYLEKTSSLLNNFDHFVFRGAKSGLPWFAETSVFVRKV